MGATTTYVTHRNPSLMARNMLTTSPGSGFLLGVHSAIDFPDGLRERLELSGNRAHKVELNSAAFYVENEA